MDFSTAIQGLGVLGVALVGLTVGIQRVLKGWKESSVESSVITIMHTELERMSAQNSILASELNKLQLEIVKLNAELRKLTIENQQLHAEIARLTAEVSRLQTLLI